MYKKRGDAVDAIKDEEMSEQVRYWWIQKLAEKSKKVVKVSKTWPFLNNPSQRPSFVIHPTILTFPHFDLPQGIFSKHSQKTPKKYLNFEFPCWRICLKAFKPFESAVRIQHKRNEHYCQKVIECMSTIDSRFGEFVTFQVNEPFALTLIQI